MERDGRVKISTKHTVYDYLNLNLSLYSCEEDWQKAIEIVEDRFWERFFSTIHYLSVDYRGRHISVDKVEKNGFAIMALNCLLVDTFYQFEYGLESSSEENPVTGDRGNHVHYVQFLRAKFPQLFCDADMDLADIFYKDIRCGILHSAQTKGGSMLACTGNGPTIMACNNNGNIGVRVEVSKLSEELEDYFRNDYLRRLKAKDQPTREAFLRKMTFIAR